MCLCMFCLDLPHPRTRQRDLTRTSTSWLVTHDNAGRGSPLKLTPPHLCETLHGIGDFPWAILFHTSVPQRQKSSGEGQRGARGDKGQPAPRASAAPWTRHAASLLPSVPLPPVGMTVALTSQQLQCLRTRYRVHGALEASPQTSRVAWGRRASVDRLQRRGPNSRRTGAPVGASMPLKKANRVRFIFSRISSRANAVSQMKLSCFRLYGVPSLVILKEKLREFCLIAPDHWLHDSGFLASLLRPVSLPPVHPQGLFLVESDIISLTGQPDSWALRLDCKK